MKVSDIIIEAGKGLSKPRPKKINKGNGGKTTTQYVDNVPDINNPIAKSVLSQPHLKQRVMPNKRSYKRNTKINIE